MSLRKERGRGETKGREKGRVELSCLELPPSLV